MMNLDSRLKKKVDISPVVTSCELSIYLSPPPPMIREPNTQLPLFNIYIFWGWGGDVGL